MGMSVARVDGEWLLDHMFESLNEGQGGWIVTANLDILRRHHLDAEARKLYDDADIRVADGMPLVWASRVQGQDLPERVAGSTMVWHIAHRAAWEERSIYLLGGDEGAGEAAAEELVRRSPGLTIAGTSNPWVSSPVTDDEVEALVAEIGPAPDILLVGLGSPKQEYVCQALRSRYPHTWLIGVGISFSFVAGQVKRAPLWAQKTGLEWVHRMSQEPRRLFRRYIIDDLPFAVRLFGKSALARKRRSGR